LIGVDGETPRRNARERHYKARMRRMIVVDDGQMTAEEQHRTATTVLRIMVDDLRGAIGDRTFGTRRGHSELRIPGEVDQQGWEEFSRILDTAMVEIEETMVQSALRLEEGGRAGDRGDLRPAALRGSPVEIRGRRPAGPGAAIALDRG
jgi:hypothetical protein